MEVSRVPDVTFRRYEPADREWVVTSNIRHYRSVEGFDSDFDTVVIRTMDDLERRASDGRSHFILAEVDESKVGCVFFSAESEATGRIRLFYLDEAYRGRGIGKKMMKVVMSRAVASGFETIDVSTFDRHEAACHVYSSLGFEVESVEPVLAFGRRMRRWDFGCDLRRRSP